MSTFDIFMAGYFAGIATFGAIDLYLSRPKR